MDRLHQGPNVSNVPRPRRHTGAKLPFRPAIPEEVIIIGTGITGCTAGWLLSEIGYRVMFIEQSPEPFASTSIGALGIHLGGRYPRDWNTAIECLRSGIKLKRHMNFAFSHQKLRFLVADDSPISFDDYVDFYKRLRNYYADLPISDHMFGEPDHFFRKLQPHELRSFTGITGGIVTQEACFNMDKVRATLMRTLEARGATFSTSTRVINIRKRNESVHRYEIETLNLRTRQHIFKECDILVNAAGPNVRTFSQSLGYAPASRLDLRFFHDISVSDQAQKAYPFPFAVIPGHMHYVPLRNNVASLVGFRREVLGSQYVSEHDTFNMPKAWQKQLTTRIVINDEMRSAAIIKSAKERFMPKLGKPELLAAYPGVAVSFNPEGHIKLQLHVEPIAALPGYFPVCPTKASHALSLAFELARFCVIDSKHRDILTSLSMYAQNVLQEKYIGYIPA